MKLTSVPLVVTGAAASATIPTDTRTLGPGGVGVSVTNVGGGCTYQVQISMDDPYSAAGVTNWASPATGQFTGLVSGSTVSAGTYIGQITTFCTAVRLNVTAGSGTTSILVWQADSTQGA